MFELALFSVIVGLFVKGWLGKLLVFPCIIALYATLKFYFSPKAKAIRENSDFEVSRAKVGSYFYIFAYKYLICATVSGLTGLIAIAVH
ncbi:MAG: hypothetical protein PHN84_15820 [Desulfuromonadaceae bacterium]|nr:hypothetical protein [Desulfuromonadaceae bacterium]MDD2856603.1 hypothetical protein [Desulfuromonadaceae bacterium]